MNRRLALSHGPPVQVSRILLGARLVTISAYASTVAPSPGSPDLAASNVREESLTSIVTALEVATVSATWADPIGPGGVGFGVAGGTGVDVAVGPGVEVGVGAAVAACVGGGPSPVRGSYDVQAARTPATTSNAAAIGRVRWVFKVTMGLLWARRAYGAGLRCWRQPVRRSSASHRGGPETLVRALPDRGCRPPRRIEKRRTEPQASVRRVRRDRWTTAPGGRTPAWLRQ